MLHCERGSRGKLSWHGRFRGCVVRPLIYKGHRIDQFSRTSGSARRESARNFSRLERLFAGSLALLYISVISRCRSDDERVRVGKVVRADHAKPPNRINRSHVVSVFEDRLLRTDQARLDFSADMYTYLPTLSVIGS